MSHLKLFLIKILILAIITSNSVFSKSLSKLEVNLNQDNDNTCYYGVVGEIKTLIESIIDSFREGNDSFHELDKYLEFSSALADSFKADENTDLTELIKKYSELLSELELTEDGLDVLIRYHKFDKILGSILPIFKELYKNKPAPYAEEALQVVYLNFNLKVLSKYQKIDSECVDFENLYFKISGVYENQQPINFFPFTSDKFAVVPKNLKDHISFVYYRVINPSDFENTNKVSIMTLSKSDEGQLHLASIYLQYTENNKEHPYSIVSDLFGTKVEVPLNAKCADVVSIILTFSNNYNGYNAALSIRSVHDNSRKTFNFKVTPNILENSIVTILKKEIKNSIIIKFIRCGNDNKETLNQEVEVLTQFLPFEIKVAIFNLKQNCENPVCDITDINGDCYVCPETSFKQNGNCVEKCNDGYYPDQNKECQPCINCETCANKNECITCKADEILLDKECITVCPDNTIKTQKTDGSFECKPCTPQCGQCGSTEECIKCENGTFLYEGKCIECQDGTYREWNPSRCIDCDEHCTKCSANTCYTCEQGYYLNKDGECVKDCSIGTYLNEKEKVCEECSKNCKECKGATDCIECKSGFVKENEKCNPICSEGYIRIEDGSCAPCIPNCITCFPNDRTTCEECDSNHVISKNGKCIEECKEGQVEVNGKCEDCPKNCKVCVNIDSCEVCLDGFQKMPDGTCIFECPNGYYQNENHQCVPCNSDGKCLSCAGTDDGHCITCDKGKVLEDGKCKEECDIPSYVDLNKNCIPCSDDKCVECNKYGCIVCEEPYYVLNGVCVKDCKEGEKDDSCAPCQNTECYDCVTGSNLCEKCKEPKFELNGICIEHCPSGFYETTVDNKKTCLPCSSLPDCYLCNQGDHCIVCEEGFKKVDKECVEICKDGTFEEGKTCKPCEINCVKCTSSENCEECKSGYVLSSGKCIIECDSNQYRDENNECQNCKPTCSTCKDKNDDCITCPHNMILTENKECKYKCEDGKYVNELNECVVCTPTACLTCDGKNLCIECKDGTILLDGECVPSCIDGYKADDKNKKCEECKDENCLTCDSKVSICDECKEGSYLYNEKCVPSCPKGTYPSNKECLPCPIECLECDASKDCITCQDTLYLKDGKCVDCPEGFYGDNITRTCEPCDVNNCIKCDSQGTECNECKYPFVLYNNNCLEKCPNSTRLKIDEYSCEECLVPNCTNCKTEQSNCDECLPGLYHYNGSCVECPEGTFVDIKNKECKKCEEHCLECKSEEDCKVCEKEYILFNGDCFINCPEGYIEINKRCEKCEADKCKVCANDSVDLCKECEKGTVLNPDTQTCVETCPNGKYMDPITNRCEPCHVTCLTCETKDECKTCQEGKILVKGECSDSCPEKLVNVNGECKPCETKENCLKCDSTQLDECIICKGDLILYNGVCIEKCKEGFRELPNKTCEPCSLNCSTCDQNECIECKDGFYLKEGKCVIDCGKEFYASNEICNPCNDTCEVCKSSQDCIVCKEDYLIKYVNGILTCVKSCEEGEYSNGTECKPCTDPNCNVCSNSNTCDDCKTPYINQNGRCVELCKEGYVPVGKECIVCEDAYCLECSNPNYCIACEKPYVEFNGDCIIICPKGYVKNNDKCEPCPDNCDNCPKDPSQCIVCKDPYVVFPDGSCGEKCEDGSIPVNGVCWECPVDACTVCYVETGACKVCDDGFFLNEDFECVKTCSEKEYKSYNDKECKPCEKDCKTCKEGVNCESCESPLVLIDGRCKSPCEEKEIRVNGECKPCDDKNCKLCVTVDNCIECDIGYVINPITKVCVEECPEGYFKNSQNICIKCSPECKDCDSKENCIECIDTKVKQGDSCIDKCFDGYVNVDGVCVECVDTECKKCGSELNLCIVCYEGTVLKNGICVPECKAKEGEYVLDKGDLGSECKPCIEYCLQCKNDSTCDKCKEGYLLKNGKCVEDCGDGYTEFESKCKPCADNCNECPTDPSSCITCEAPAVKFNGICIIVCPNGFYKNIQEECVPCIPDCILCQTGSSCEVCNEGKYLNNGICVDKCPDGTTPLFGKECTPCIDTNCKECNTSIDKCIVCKDLYYEHLDESTKLCVVDCPEGYYKDEQTKKCLPCDVKCKTCEEQGSCTTCIEPFTLKDGQCIVICNDKEALVDGKCIPCVDKDCHLCPKDEEVCILCVYPKVLKDNKCIELCEDGSYPRNGKCINCEESCEACKSAEECLVCKDPHVKIDGVCVLICPDKYVKVNDECKPCSDSDCLKCDGVESGQCKDCETKILYEGTCIDSCPKGTFYNKETDSCEECIKNCDICKNNKSCDVCSKENVLLNKICIEECPEGYIKINKECIKCEDNDCKTCLPVDLDYCTSCKDDRILLNGSCIDVCTEGTYEVIINGKRTCKDCSDNCKECEKEFDKCISCKGEQKLIEESCVDLCPDGKVKVNGECKRCTDTKCKNCDSLDVDNCYECVDPLIKVEGLCVDNCKPNQFRDETSKKCADCPINCDKCDKSGCELCAKGTYPMEDSKECQPCVEPNQVINGECKECKADNCKVCVNGDDNKCEICKGEMKLLEGKCVEECINGTYRDGTICKPCADKCIVCKDEKECIECKEPNVLYEGVCNPVCPPNTHVVNGECKPCSDENCLYCDAKNLDICIKCKGNYILDNGECIEKCPEKYYYDETTSKCIKCEELCNTCNKSNCVICEAGTYLDDGKCVKDCKEGYKMNSVTGTCDECSVELCSKCQTRPCDECVDGFKLTTKEKCESTCPEGEYNPGTDKCEKCSLACIDCESKEECNKCEPPFKLLNGKCVQFCNENQTEKDGKCVPCEDKNCHKCEVGNQGNCIECNTPFILSSGACVEECSHGFYKDGKKCEECPKECEACESADKCTQCPENFVFIEGKCISTCPDGNYKDTNDTCTPCSDDKCKICKPNSEGDSCVVCEDGFLLIDGTCHTECPSGTKEVDSSCVPCPVGCKECNKDECTECKPLYFLQNGVCDFHCHPGTAGDCSTHRCQPCHISCKICKGKLKTDCLECKEGYVSKEGDLCVLPENCDFGTFGNTITGKCEDCKDKYCKTCDQNKCKQCEEGYELFNGKCEKGAVIVPVFIEPAVLSPKNCVDNIEKDVKILTQKTETTVVVSMKSLNIKVDSSKTESKIISLNTPSLKLEILLFINGEDNKCSVKLTKDSKVFEGKGPDCGDKVLDKETFIILFLQVDSTGKVNAEIQRKIGSITVSSGQILLEDTGITVLGSSDTVADLRNEYDCPYQGHVINKVILSSSVLSTSTIEKITSPTVIKVEGTCTDKDLCNEKNNYIVLSSGLNKENTSIVIGNTYNTQDIIENYKIEVLIHQDKDSKETSFELVNKVENSPNFDSTSLVVEVKISSSVITPSVSEGVISLPKVSVANWIVIVLDVHKDGLTGDITYTVVIKDAVTSEVLYKITLLDDKTPEDTSALHVHTEFQSNSATGAIIFHDLNEVKDKVTIDILDTVKNIFKNENCEDFNSEALCIKCENDFKLNEISNKCENIHYIGCKEIESQVYIGNNESKFFNAVFKQGVNTLIINTLKTHLTSLSYRDPSPYVYNLISFLVESEHKLVEVVQVKVQEGKYSLLIDGTEIPVGDILSEINFIITYVKNESVSITNSVNGLSKTLNLKVIDNVLFGDNKKKEINTLIRSSLLCYKQLTPEEVLDVLKNKLDQINPACLDSSNSKCTTCYGGRDVKNECEVVLIGKDYIKVCGLQDLMTDKEERAVALVEHIPNSVSEHYLATANIFIHTAPENGRVEILKVENSAVNGSSHVIGLLVYVYQAGVGKAQYETSSIVVPLNHIDTTKENHYIIEYKYNEKKVIVHTYNDNIGQKEVTINTNVERLTSQLLVSLISNDSQSVCGEFKGFYVIPNPKDIDVNLLFTNENNKFNKVNEEKNCQFTAQDETCLKCNEGFDLQDKACESKTVIDSNEKGYKVLTDGVTVKAAESQTINSPFSESELNLSCHIKHNYSKFNDETTLFIADKVRLSLVESEGTNYIKTVIGEKIVLLGPFTKAQVSKWISYVLTINSNGFRVKLRDSLTGTTLDWTFGPESTEIPKTFTTYNSDNSNSIANCHLTEKYYDVSVLPAPEDKSINCDLFIDGECKSSDWGVEEKKSNEHEIHINNLVVKENETPIVVELKDLVGFESTLCSNSFRFSSNFYYNFSKVTGHGYKNIVKLNFKDNYISIKQSKSNPESFILAEKNYITTVKSQKINIVHFNLPSKIVNAFSSIVISKENNLLNVLIQNSYTNYVHLKLELEGPQDCLSPQAKFEFGEEESTENSSVVLSVKDINTEPERSFTVSELFERSSELIEKIQIACSQAKNPEDSCSKCAESYELKIDNNGKKGCAIPGNSYVNNLTLISEVNQDQSLVVSSDVKESISSLNVILQVTTTSNGIAVVQLDDKKILEVYVESSTLVVVNSLSSKTIEVPNAIRCDSSTTLFTISISVNTVDGSTSLIVYDSETERLESSSSFGTGVAVLSGGKLEVVYGYKKNENEFKFKVGATLLNVNGRDVTSEDVKLLNVRHLLSNENCKSKLTGEGFDLCLNRFSSKLKVENGKNLFYKLQDYVKDYSKNEANEKYTVELKFKPSKLNSKYTNSNLLFVLDNNVPQSISSTYLISDIMSESTEGTCRISVVYNNEKIHVSTSKRDIELIGVFNDLLNFNEVQVKINVNAKEKTINIVVIADDLTIKQSVYAPEVEGVFPDTQVYKNPDIEASIDFNENNKLTEKIDCESFKVEKDNCKIENCLACLLNDEGKVFCQQCQKEFIFSENKDVCIPKVVVHDKKFIDQ